MAYDDWYNQASSSYGGGMSVDPDYRDINQMFNISQPTPDVSAGYQQQPEGYDPRGWGALQGDADYASYASPDVSAGYQQQPEGYDPRGWGALKGDTGYASYASGAPSNTAFDGIWAGIKDAATPKEGWGAAIGKKAVDLGGNALAGWLSPKPDMGSSNAMSAQMMASLDKLNRFNEQQAVQYNQNVAPLQNVATQMALTAANPTERANRASADFTMYSNARRKQREQQLTAAGTRPGSPEWVSAMADLDQADAIGHADAYNKGLQTAYDTGSQQLSSAYAMHPAPNYGAEAQSYGSGASQQANLAKLQNDMRASNIEGWQDIITGEYSKKKQLANTGLAGPTRG